MKSHQNYSPAEHMAGPIFLGIMALIYNTVATRRKHPTISTGVRWIAHKENGPEIVGAVIGSLLFHWFLKGHKDG